MSAIPVSVALVAGVLAVFNPCGLPVLSAFLAYNLGAGASQPSPAPDRIARGLGTGLLVAVGVLGVFTVLGLPLSFGVAEISNAVPWLGIAFGAALLATGLLAVSGRQIPLPRTAATLPRARRRAATQLLFGVGYGVASLACTLPVFLTLVGAASSGGSPTATLIIFASYGAGLALALTALAVGTAIVSGSLSRWAGRALPVVAPFTGGLLAVAGAYLVYYWLRVGTGSPAAAASDRLVAAVTDFAAWVETRAQDSAGVPLLAGLAAFLTVAALISLRRSARKESPVTTDRPGHDQSPTRPRLRVAAGALTLAVLGGLVGYGIGISDSDPSTRGDPSRAEQAARPVTEAERESLHIDGRAANISTFTGIGQLQARFDEDTGATRVIALLSPTCVTCLRGASWIQQELATHPEANVRVYAVWLPLLPSDGRAEWDGRILNDPRVIHLWDEEQVAGRWFARRGYGELPVQWDAMFLYGPDSEWKDNDEPSDLVIWGRPIIAHAADLTEKMQPLLDQPS